MLGTRICDFNFEQIANGIKRSMIFIWIDLLWSKVNSENQLAKLSYNFQFWNKSQMSNQQVLRIILLKVDLYLFVAKVVFQNKVDVPY